ncbi:hypothetical protein P775_12570 [Puniceibacterium antarcticum]|uniref:Uncharacterized protein n=1 Tax=Puniceibacterium antarcticum TaxID=1206336 RepID=A0A2G8RE96_9RHOB|nr:hypothetical protein [Puniceibacterium antarcticum]PIL19842.1 hypothetical protein P775_12570 [Puniceibacterium antarcticum]
MPNPVYSNRKILFEVAKANFVRPENVRQLYDLVTNDARLNTVGYETFEKQTSNSNDYPNGTPGETIAALAEFLVNFAKEIGTNPIKHETAVRVWQGPPAAFRDALRVERPWNRLLERALALTPFLPRPEWEIEGHIPQSLPYPGGSEGTDVFRQFHTEVRFYFRFFFRSASPKTIMVLEGLCPIVGVAKWCVWPYSADQPLRRDVRCRTHAWPSGEPVSGSNVIGTFGRDPLYKGKPGPKTINVVRDPAASEGRKHVLGIAWSPHAAPEPEVVQAWLNPANGVLDSGQLDEIARTILPRLDQRTAEMIRGEIRFSASGERGPKDATAG